MADTEAVVDAVTQESGEAKDEGESWLMVETPQAEAPAEAEKEPRWARVAWQLFVFEVDCIAGLISIGA